MIAGGVSIYWSLAEKKCFCHGKAVKVIPLEQAKIQLGAIFEEVLTGSIIRVAVPGGRQVEISPVQTSPITEISSVDLAAAYDDSEWAEFENNCGKASD
jgi:hypothetical protein